MFLPRLRIFSVFLIAGAAASAQALVQASGTASSLRGVSAVSERVAWASGAKGTVLRTLDGGATWTLRPVTGAADGLDFRDLHAFDQNTAIVMSAGLGDLSRIYKTSDGGEHWSLLFQNRQEKGFFDAIKFWDAQRGLVLGDAVDGRMVVLRTEDGGATWIPVEARGMPLAREGEGAFAASGTSLALRPGGLAWFATGGTGGARVFRSVDWGRSWEAADTPVRHDGPGSGIFSIAFWDDRRGMVVGGNYTKPAEAGDSFALTADGGRTWSAASGSQPNGYRSAVVLMSGLALATGAGGTDISRDGGRTWSPMGSAGFHALSRAGNVVWAVGDKGAIARFTMGQ